MKKEQNSPDSKPDLKHDSMEFSASTDGDDKLDTDDANYEETGISGEELGALNDDEANEAAAFIAEENDFAADDNNLPEEDWTDDLPDMEDGDEDGHQRK